MPEHHRPHAAAGHATPLTDPVLTVRPLGRSVGLTRRLATQADSALVLSTAKGGYQVYLPPHRPGLTDLVGRAYQAAYEVDLAVHHLRLTERLPGQDDVGAFEAVVDVDWQVSAAERVVMSRIRDVPALLAPRIRQRMRVTARTLATDLSGEAELAVQRALDEQPLADAEGLRVTCAVRLDLDPAAQAQKELLRSYHFSRQAHPLALRQVQEENEILAAKSKFYQYHLEEGGVAAWALQLAQHPDDLPRALEHLRGEQQDLVRNQIHLVEKLLGQGTFEQFQLEDSSRAALEAITAILRQAPGSGVTPELGTGPAAPYPN
ncbi:PE-PGRS family protein [Kitasatospora sp. NPDC092286]|uniref:PE-PGRS family protein n=1 Tax=Kitasatospora sp. NPDC092286 TaxID=3364087 RepID=UPI0037F27CA9